jgi:3-oxoisoapionate kinase
MPLPTGPLVAFYGDDFTGSAATLEAMAFAGLKSILLFEIPSAEQLLQFTEYQSIGIAGLARSKSPAWMDVHLPEVFACLKATRASLAHYKICSTFDSAPHVGNIGKAIELAEPIFQNNWTPVLPAVPQLARWQAFGNLYAGSSGSTYRIDRHPVMSRHPTTPMAEADLRLHLAQQTKMKIGLVDLVDLKSEQAQQKIAHETEQGAGILLIDTVDDETQAAAGRLLWEGREQRQFVVGSQGIEYALLAHWRKAGLLGQAPQPTTISKVDRIAIVSGSCSSTTARQIDMAAQNGFEAIAAKTHLVVEAAAWNIELKRLIAAGLQALSQGQSPLIYSAKGPDDPEVATLNQAIATSKSSQEDISLRIGSGLGVVLDAIVKEAKLTRAVVAGGDSSGQACIAMGLTGVTVLAPLGHSAPLCRATSKKQYLDGLEIALKGGQMGAPTYFIQAKG